MRVTTQDDDRPSIPLNDEQRAIVAAVNARIADGTYATEQVPCGICGHSGDDLEPLSAKDRYGIRYSVMICRHCGLIQNNPRLQEGAFRDFYRTYYRRIDRIQGLSPEKIFLDQYDRARRIFSILQALSPQTGPDPLIVEMGCCSGGTLAYFREQGCDVVGVDLDEEYMNYGRKRYGLDLRSGPLTDLNLKRPPDAVILSHTLEHLLQPQQELQTIRSLLAPRGLLYIEVPGIRNLTFNFYDMDLHKYLLMPHTYHFSLSSLKNLMGKAGFRMLKGNEIIRSVFSPSGQEEAVCNDYPAVMKYLQRTTVLRHLLPLTPYRVRYAGEALAYFFLKKTGMFPGVRSLYYKFLKRRRP